MPSLQSSRPAMNSSSVTDVDSWFLACPLSFCICSNPPSLWANDKLLRGMLVKLVKPHMMVPVLLNDLCAPVLFCKILLLVLYASLVVVARKDNWSVQIEEGRA